VNYLFRATGPVVKGSVALIAESFLRVALMTLLLLGFGIVGLPLGASLTACMFGLFAQYWTRKELSFFAQLNTERRIEVWAFRFILLMVGFTLGYYVHVPSWWYVLVVGSLLTIGGGFVLIFRDPLLFNIRAMVCKMLFYLLSHNKKRCIDKVVEGR
jgi:peptidoglycan biosynthesis protein MviN/MurJ (putative lipid II flippase)